MIEEKLITFVFKRNSKLDLELKLASCASYWMKSNSKNICIKIMVFLH